MLFKLISLFLNNVLKNVVTKKSKIMYVAWIISLLNNADPE